MCCNTHETTPIVQNRCLKMCLNLPFAYKTSDLHEDAQVEMIAHSGLQEKIFDFRKLSDRSHFDKLAPLSPHFLNSLKHIMKWVMRLDFSTWLWGHCKELPWITVYSSWSRQICHQLHSKYNIVIVAVMGPNFAQNVIFNRGCPDNYQWTWPTFSSWYGAHVKQQVNQTCFNMVSSLTALLLWDSMPFKFWRRIEWNKISQER